MITRFSIEIQSIATLLRLANLTKGCNCHVAHALMRPRPNHVNAKYLTVLLCQRGHETSDCVKEHRKHFRGRASIRSKGRSRAKQDASFPSAIARASNAPSWGLSNIQQLSN